MHEVLRDVIHYTLLEAAMWVK